MGLDLGDGYRIQTLLMTDVVGSTRLWAANPQAMPGAIERLEAIAQAAVDAQGGEVVKRRGEGDSLFCLLPHPAAAARAAADLVITLRNEPWPEGLRLKVRASIHCGPAHARGTDLFGPMPNRCARLREVGHGDQILLSGAARAQIGAADGIGLRDLGRHRLRDLDEPESIYQVAAEGLPEEFPPLRSLTCLRNNLPTQYTSFIGRETLRTELKERLLEDRFTTLTGAGGSGKTRLSLQLGAETIDAFPDGVWFVELAEVSDEPSIVRAIADACGQRDLPDGNAIGALADRLRGQSRALFLLDNAEHALGLIARAVSRLAGLVPELHFLITSREPLRLRGERIYRVPPLTVPSVGCDDPAEVGTTEAGALFVDRARLRLPDFELGSANALAVTHIVRRLDGIPLCLEMAASHVDYLGSDEIAARLQDRFALLEGDDVDAPPRHRTMRETIAWQYDTLSKEEALLLQRLAAFAGGFALAGAEAVGGTPPLDPARVVRHLRALVDKSLVVATPDGGGMRYRLLETIAQFASECPEAETARAMSALFDWALAIAETSYAKFYGTEHDRWREIVENDLASIHRALDWAFAELEPRTPLAALRMTRFWHMSGRYGGGRIYLLRAAHLSSDEIRAETLSALGVFCNCLGDASGAEEAFRKAVDDPLADARTRGRALANLAISLNDGARYNEALQAYDQGVEALASCGDEYGARLCRLNRALLYSDMGRDAEAVEELGQVVEESTAAGDVYRAAVGLSAIASMMLLLPDVECARDSLRRAMDIAQADGPTDFYESAFLNAASLAAQDGNDEVMAYLLGAHERIHSELGSKYSPRIARLAERLLERTGNAGSSLDGHRLAGKTASIGEAYRLIEGLVKGREQGRAAWGQTRPSLEI